MSSQNFAQTSSSATISKGTYDLFVGNFISTVLLAIATIIIGRLLGPSEYGLFTVALIIPSYAYLFLRLGISSTITRYGARYLSKGDQKRAVSFTYTLNILHLALGVIAVGILIPFSNAICIEILHRPALANGVIIPVAILSVVGQILFYDVTAAFVGLHSFGKSAAVQVVMGVLRVGVSTFLLLFSYSVFGAMIGYTSSFIVAGAISLVLLVLMNRSFKPAKVAEVVSTSIRFAPSIYLSTVLTYIISPVQSTILAFTVSNVQIGWYAAALNLSALMMLFTYPISTMVLPVFSRATAHGNADLADAYKMSVRYAALIVTPVTMFLMAVSMPLATAVFGSAYQSSGTYFLLIAAATLLPGIGGLSADPFLYGVGQTRKVLIANSLGTATAILLSVLLAREIGVYGVILGMIIGQVVSLSIALHFVSKLLRTGLQILSVWRIYLSSTLSAVIIYPLSLLHISRFLFLPLGGIAFLLVLVPLMTWSRALTLNDVKGLKQLFEKVGIVKKTLDYLERYCRLLSLR